MPIHNNNSTVYMSIHWLELGLFPQFSYYVNCNITSIYKYLSYSSPSSFGYTPKKKSFLIIQLLRYFEERSL